MLKKKLRTTECMRILERYSKALDDRATESALGTDHFLVCLISVVLHGYISLY